MDVIEATRNLGEVMQKDERFIAYAKARLDLDKDESLQNKIGEFNIARMNVERIADEENRDEEKFREANLNLRSIYDEIMQSETMKAYETSKTELEKMMNDIMAIIHMCSEGADPKTCEIPQGGCTGSCSTCAGCH